jgi:2,4-dienoyl-CoA reductase-like NADH-dependent reductase (Old Yellow Enzyme family)
MITTKHDIYFKNTLAESYPFSTRVSPNRLVAQAMETNDARDGAVSPGTIDRYARLAEGGWGMVFVEAISITDRHLARNRGLVITGDRLDGFKRLVESFKKVDDRALLLFQVTHSGRLSGNFSIPVKAYEDDAAGIPTLSEAELDEALDQCTAAALLAREAGADGVDIKACHGYLGGELLRPRNARDDRYGTSAQNRARYVATVIARVKSHCPDFLVGSRVSLYEGIRGGCGTAGPEEVIEDLTDILAVLSVIVNAGADFINVSAGIPALTPGLTRPSVTGDVNLYHHFRYARAVKERFGRVAVIGSAYSTAQEGGLRYAEENIEKGYADLAGFGRQSLADPLFPKKIFSDSGEIDYCTLCGGCSRLLKKQEVVYCTRYGKDRPGRP